MIVSVFVRRLRDGRTYDDFMAAWYPETGFGVPTRVLNAVRVDDPAEILSLGFLDVSEDDLASLGKRIARAEAARHERIAEVIESNRVPRCL
jgi:hypothetical protein